MTIILQTIISAIAIVALFSIVNSLLLETFRRVINNRYEDLKKSIQKLLEDSDSSNLSEEFFNHAFIDKLTEAEGNGKLTWIPSDVFAETFIEMIIAKGSKKLNFKHSPTQLAEVKKCFLEGVNDLPDNLKQATIQLYRYVEDQHGDELSTLKAKVAGFYEAYMDRISAMYKNKTRISLFILGLILSCALNLDLIKISYTLFNDDDLRIEYYNLGQSLSQSEIEVNEEVIITYLTENKKNINGNNLLKVVAKNLSAKGDSTIAFVAGSNNLPIGWVNKSDTFLKGTNHSYGILWVIKILGWILMAATLAYGAPFWFDLLKKITRLEKIL